MIQSAPVPSTESILRGCGRPSGVVIATARNGWGSTLTTVAVCDQGQTDLSQKLVSGGTRQKRPFFDLRRRSRPHHPSSYATPRVKHAADLPDS